MAEPHKDQARRPAKPEGPGRPCFELGGVARGAGADPQGAQPARELDPVERQRVREEYFASGLERWLPLIDDFSFPSVCVPLPRACCAALAWAAQDAPAEGTPDTSKLARRIDAALAEHGWSKVFVKLSTRSPKDAPQILAHAAEAFRKREPFQLPLAERTRLFAELLSEQFSVSSGAEAVELLASSARVREDLEYALEAPRYDDLGLSVVLRKWDGPIPLENEFRGIVWDGKLNALGQYYHPLFFPELADARERIAPDVRSVYQSLHGKLMVAGFTHFVVDFAWLGPGDVRIIEISPFDGAGAGAGGCPASTGLFRKDDESDCKVITEGPFEFRLRQEPLPDEELSQRLSPAWRDIISLPAAAPAPAG
mmetsp:Transcript_29291/g.91018  ORF Transcript_29291/g.91018 Transcript_29291/m.91018 type:complete len:369 (-) Transcript_29291:261-1367(-)